MGLGHFFFNCTQPISRSQPLKAITKRFFASDRKLKSLTHYRFCFFNFDQQSPEITGESDEKMTVYYLTGNYQYFPDEIPKTNVRTNRAHRRHSNNC